MFMMELDELGHGTTMLRRTMAVTFRDRSPYSTHRRNRCDQPTGVPDMATRSETKLYMDINPAEFGPEYEKLVKQERELYEAQKLIRKAQADYLNAKTSLGEGYTVISTTWTRWGQHQAVCDKASAKAAPKASSRPSLSDYLKGQKANGASH
jgi:hypothetical protein